MKKTIFQKICNYWLQTRDILIKRGSPSPLPINHQKEQIKLTLCITPTPCTHTHNTKTPNTHTNTYQQHIILISSHFIPIVQKHAKHADTNTQTTTTYTNKRKTTQIPRSPLVGSYPTYLCTNLHTTSIIRAKHRKCLNYYRDNLFIFKQIC